MKLSCNNRNMIVCNICEISSEIKNIINSLEYCVNVHVSNIKIITVCLILKLSSSGMQLTVLHVKENG